jgi:hypothetical protein
LVTAVLLAATAPSAIADPYVFTQIDVPNATRTQARGINDIGQIAGWFQDDTGGFHGYVLSDGVFSPLDVPDSTATLTLGFNNLSQSVGTVDDSNFVGHGFLCTAEGECTVHDPPGSELTIAVGANDNEEIVGVFYTNGLSEQHGYKLSNGSFNLIDFPAVAHPGAPVLTTAHDINNAGQIVGVAEIESATRRS